MKWLLMAQGVFLLGSLGFLALGDPQMAIAMLVAHGGVLFAKGCIEAQTTK